MKHIIDLKLFKVIWGENSQALVNSSRFTTSEGSQFLPNQTLTNPAQSVEQRQSKPNVNPKQFLQNPDQTVKKHGKLSTVTVEFNRWDDIGKQYISMGPKDYENTLEFRNQIYRSLIFSPNSYLLINGVKQHFEPNKFSYVLQLIRMLKKDLFVYCDFDNYSKTVDAMLKKSRNWTGTYDTDHIVVWKCIKTVIYESEIDSCIYKVGDIQFNSRELDRIVFSVEGQHGRVYESDLKAAAKLLAGQQANSTLAAKTIEERIRGLKDAPCNYDDIN